MKRSQQSSLKYAAVGATLAFALGASYAFAADNCRFAYRFCMPRYYDCLASGAPANECHAELDACILRNGCSTLP
jgi:hypothetical protein